MFDIRHVHNQKESINEKIHIGLLCGTQILNSNSIEPQSTNIMRVVKRARSSYRPNYGRNLIKPVCLFGMVQVVFGVSETRLR